MENMLEKVKFKGFIWPIVIGLIIWFTTGIRPSGVSVQAWHMLALFVGTIIGCITQPLSIAGVTLIGFTLTVGLGLSDMKTGLTAFSNSAAWLIAMAFMLSRGVIKTGLGRRIALYFVRMFGKRTLGLAYSIMGIDLVTSPAIPSNTARAGGVVYPIIESLARTFGSKTEDGTQRKMGAYLVFTEFHANLLTSALFMTAMAPNLVTAQLAGKLHVNLTWMGWFAAASVPILICLAVVPLIIYKMYPPEIKETPNAKDWANKELATMGKMKLSEKIMGSVFILTLILWMLSSFIGMDATFVAFLAICILLITGVLSVNDLVTEKGAWTVLIWLSILVFMAGKLTEFGFITWMSKSIASGLHGVSWVLMLAILAIVLFYSHYLFASATAHVSAMYAPFLAVAIGAGAPAQMSAMLLAMVTAVMASTTHYANGPASILAGSGYVKQSDWWRMNFVLGIFYLLVIGIVGPLWMKVIGLW
ncbi:DASS family sodium-coupled anion symporter [Companilactobacillus jidongensis]|uniref:DASS family sodium-coupled anion symporter n=1 Tax=Companilactobacillus jidongensis TaxID=2486006 RepID=UPI000F7B81A6|nr:DASS family sodium-coupled anion symporter [Companilactobacillus jidongensis]